MVGSEFRVNGRPSFKKVSGFRMLEGYPGDCTSPDARKDVLRLFYRLEFVFCFQKGLLPGTKTGGHLLV